MEAPVESGNGTEVEAHSLIENLFSLAGKTAVVVGGGGVLAGEMAMGLAGAGANIVIADLNEDQAKRHAEAILGLGRKSLACQADVSRKADVQRILEATLEKFGGVDILLNAAGINSGTPFFEIEEAEWERIIAVDLRSIFLACQVFGKAMIEAGKGGSIINISSASSGPPLSKVFTYSVAKGGVNQITQFLAREFAPYRIRVNAILPGFFPAEQNRKLLTEERTASIMKHTPMGRYGAPSELIGAAVYLASDKASSFVTGSLVRVDGGFAAMTI
jgi:NAD(P)-dependent dehydrogenase (short-subunit alcohol dehydrogenase family)